MVKNLYFDCHCTPVFLNHITWLILLPFSVPGQLFVSACQKTCSKSLSTSSKPNLKAVLWKKLVRHGKSLINKTWYELVRKLSRFFLNVNIFLEFYKIAKDNLRKYPAWLNEAVIPKADDIQPGQSKHFSYNLQLAQKGQHFEMRRFSISESKIFLFHHGVVVFSEVFMKWLKHSFINLSWYYQAARINRLWWFIT